MHNPGYQRIKESSLNFVRAMKMGDAPGVYRKEAGEGESFYGSYHAAHVLDLFGELTNRPAAELDAWAEQFQRRQTEQGYFSGNKSDFKRHRSLAEMEPVWHYTRGNIWALRVLGRKPERELRFLEPLLNADALRDWVKHYDWRNSWATSNQVLAAATALFAMRDWFGASEVDALLDNTLYPVLEELQDPKTGLWGTQFGCSLLSGVFGSIHILPIYFSRGWPLRHLEHSIDSTLASQFADGSFWPGGSDCPDFDGAYQLVNLAALTDYRREDVEVACRKYLAHALLHESPDGVGWLLHRRDTEPDEWLPRPHWIWREGAKRSFADLRDHDPAREKIMLGSWFYPLSIALVSHLLGDTGYEGPYHFNRHSLHVCNVFDGSVNQSL